jgi:hypothetical protein
MAIWSSSPQPSCSRPSRVTPRLALVLLAALLAGGPTTAPVVAAPATSDPGAIRTSVPAGHSRGRTTRRTRLFGGVGLALPTGAKDAPDYWGAGRGLEFGGEFRIVERAAFVVTYAADQLAFDDDRYRATSPFPPETRGHVTGEPASILLLQAGVRIRPFSRGGWDAYADALLGRGIFTTKYRASYEGPGGWGVEFGNGPVDCSSWAVGLGVRRAPPGRLGWFAEAHWVSLQVFDGTWSYVPLRTGIIWR